MPSWTEAILLIEAIQIYTPAAYPCDFVREEALLRDGLAVSPQFQR